MKESLVLSVIVSSLKACSLEIVRSSEEMMQEEDSTMMMSQMLY